MSAGSQVAGSHHASTHTQACSSGPACQVMEWPCMSGSRLPAADRVVKDSVGAHKRKKRPRDKCKDGSTIAAHACMRLGTICCAPAEVGARIGEAAAHGHPCRDRGACCPDAAAKPATEGSNSQKGTHRTVAGICNAELNICRHVPQLPSACDGLVGCHLQAHMHNHFSPCVTVCLPSFQKQA